MHEMPFKEKKQELSLVRLLHEQGRINYEQAIIARNYLHRTCQSEAYTLNKMGLYLSSDNEDTTIGQKEAAFALETPLTSNLSRENRI